MKTVTCLSCLSAIALALSACGESKKPEHSATAEGEILPGSASDGMLPYDTVRSQPPLAPQDGVSGKPSAKASGAAEEDASEAADAVPATESAPATEAETRPGAE
jgi:hypothetical protein